MNDLFDHHPSDGREGWENRLKQLRRNRSAKIADTTVSKPVRSGLQPGRYSQEEMEARRYVLGEYLKQWEAEHNLAAAEYDGPETDTAVLLQEDWLNAQTALQGAAGEEMIAKTAAVWVNPKHVAPLREAGGQEVCGAGDEKEGEKILPVCVNVLEPSVVPANRPVLCLSESELLERLGERLLPHLTDAVNGMVRTAVQRQAVQLTFQLQKSLENETPELVREVLDYNLKAAFGAIKYKLKAQK